ncbi:MAG: 30S ribosomal protein S20 [Candidatus Brennerbacteria bacterium]|nr:30S ribosomal protein S20 [Candidatus Brennerbacteria bacterium]
MPRTKSAKKALRQTIRRRARNLGRQKKIKEVTKQFKKLVEAGKIDEARALLPKVYKALDKVAKTGYVKKNKANRLKSRLAKKLRNR